MSEETSAFPDLPAQMSTEELTQQALCEIARQDDEPVPFLVALQERPSLEVFSAAVNLLDAEDSKRRELGARILRELGTAKQDGSRPFSEDANNALRRRLLIEEDPRVLAWIISAIGYNLGRTALSDVLSFVAHSDDFVRFHVAAAIPSLIDPEHPESAAIDSLVELTSDDNPDIRYYALSALLEDFPIVDDDMKRRVANAHIEDVDAQVRSLAVEQLERLS